MIAYFTRHPTAANLLMIAILAVGAVALPRINRETFPQVPAREVEVSVVHLGAAAEEVEGAICQRIEDAVDGIDNLSEKRCQAMEGRAVATLKMREGADMARFLDDVKSEIDAIDTFPGEAERPVVRQLGRTDFVAALAITGPMSARDLKAYGEDVKDRLAQIPGISQVRLDGFSDHQIRIEVPAAALRQYGLSVEDLARVVESQSIDLPSGSVETAERTVLVRFADKRRSPRTFEDLVVVAAGGGAEIRLGDIATISDRFERDEALALFNGKRAVYLSVDKSRRDDTLKVRDALEDFVTAERARAPKTVTIDITRDISAIVRDRLTMLVENGAQGLILVFLTMWLFFSLRFSFWVAMGLPVSFMGTFAVMAAFGMTVNMISMVGLLIGVGLLMDDAIVLAENIAAHRRLGKSPTQAAIDGVRQVAPGVLSSFLTTVCVFGGLAFISGDLGAILGILPVILISTLTVSLIEAFLILPHHLAHSMAHGGAVGRSFLRKRVEAGVDWLRDNIVGRVAQAAVDWRYLTVGAGIALLLVSISMIAGGVLKFRAFPDLEGNVVEARVLLPQGTPLARTKAVVARLTAAAEGVNREFTPRQPDQAALVRNLTIRYDTNSDAFESGPHVATVVIDLLDAEVRDGTTDEVLARWRQLTGPVPDVISLKFGETAIGPAGRAIDIRLMGGDLNQLKQASLQLQQWLLEFKGVVDLSDDLRPGKPEIRVRLKAGAKGLGRSAADIATQLRTAFQGRKVDDIQVGAEPYEIDIRLAQGDRDSLADLDDFTVTLAGGAQVPLGAVATLESGRGWARIHRINGLRTVTIQGDVDTRLANTAEILGDTQAAFLPGLEKRFPGIRIAFEGEARQSADTAGSLRRNVLLGLIGVFLILSFQFKSYIEPIIVMAVIPFALIGAVWGHLLLGFDLSMPSMVGLASLAGVVVNNSILLVAFIKLNIGDGMSVAEAAVAASRRRFRAILLTSLTTVMGLLPLLAETSLQAQVLQPLVASLVFGLITATVLVLLVVPSLYTILDDFGLARHAAAGAGAETDAETAG